MPRVKSLSIKRHKKVKKLAKGYRDARRKRYKAAKEAVLHAGEYAYIGRKQKKRVFRSLWIKRLNAAVSAYDLSYSKFIKLLKDKKIVLDRKILSDIAINNKDTFEQIIEFVKK